MKSLKFIIVSVIAIAIFNVNLNAQEDGVKTKAPASSDQSYTPGVYVDNDNDGVCDNHEKYHKDGKGVNFIDENNDGVCDHHSSTGRHLHKHHSHKHYKGYGHGDGNGYGHRHGWHNE